MQTQTSATTEVKQIDNVAKLTEDDNIKILLDKVEEYNASANLPLLKKAIAFCKESHKTQTRNSGEPYYTHPLAVAHILADRKMDLDSVITGLLHDVVEDTEVSLQELSQEFSKDIANLVDGVTKLTDLEKESLSALREAGGKFKALSQTANYRKMFIAISHDARVLLVKLADRLHNMRTLGGIPNPEKRNRIARETLMIYAPLAERIGLYNWKSELQDLAFRQLNARAYGEIEAHLKKMCGDDCELQKISDGLKELLASHNINAEVTSRLKSPASIWQKMEKKGLALTQLADIMAFRIIVDDIPHCYQALGIIHAEYSSFFNGFRDYISSPKPNGYQSLHTVIAGPEKRLIEIQIRTKKIHDDLENGIASHWRYKSDDDSSKKPKKSSTGQLAWLRDMMERLEKLEENPETAMQGVKLDLYQDQVFCLTPKHDIISLREGAVLLDFAYAVHTEVGHKCTGGLVNGRKQPLNHVLQNGDRIEIITSKTQTPHESWQQVAQTHHARSALQHYFKNRHRQQKITLGKNRLEKFFKHQNANLSDEVLEHALNILKENQIYNRKADTIENLYLAVGNMEIEPEEVLFAAHPGHNDKLKNEWKKKTPIERFSASLANFLSADGALIVNHPDTEFALNFASCCHPVPGDKITGIKTFGLGVTLHRADCPALHNVIAMQDRWVEAIWDKKYYGNSLYLGRLQVTMKNNPGALARACQIISNANINIGNLNFSKRVSDYYMMIFDLEVNDISQLQKAVLTLEACGEVHKVVRV